jgi:hypothetical protein
LARALTPLVSTELARRFLAAVAALPPVPPRVVYRDAARRLYLSEADAAALPAEARASFEAVTIDEEHHYGGKYGSPLAYVRALDLLPDEEALAAGGARVLDFGFGGVGQLLALAAMGFRVTGVDVDPGTKAIYGDGTDPVSLVSGRFPGGVDVGGGFQLILAKNVLKRGSVHPAEPVEDGRKVDLGLDDASFLRGVFAALAEGGRLMIYNLYPAPPAGGGYVPWADGRCPFSAEILIATGFEVEALDRDDTPFARAMGKALGWDHDDPPLDVDHGLFAAYTLVRRPPSASTATTTS